MTGLVGSRRISMRGLVGPWTPIRASVDHAMHRGRWVEWPANPPVSIPIHDVPSRSSALQLPTIVEYVALQHVMQAATPAGANCLHWGSGGSAWGPYFSHHG